MQISNAPPAGATATGVAAGRIPGAGGAAATGIVIKMCVSLDKELNIRIGEVVLKTIVSAVVADIAGVLAANLGLTLLLSFIPGVGTVGAGVLSAVTSFCYVYIAGVIYLKLVANILNKKGNISNMSEEELIKEAKKATNDVDMKEAVKEARQAYKNNNNN